MNICILIISTERNSIFRSKYFRHAFLFLKLVGFCTENERNFNVYREAFEFIVINNGIRPFFHYSVPLSSLLPLMTLLWRNKKGEQLQTTTSDRRHKSIGFSTSLFRVSLLYAVNYARECKRTILCR